MTQILVSIGSWVLYVLGLGYPDLFKEGDDMHHVESCLGVNIAKSDLMAHYRYWTKDSIIYLCQLEVTALTSVQRMGSIKPQRLCDRIKR
jgi:hypothetical protein